MNRTSLLTSCIALAACLIAGSTAHGQNDAARSDRTLFNRLVGDARAISAEYIATEDRGVRQARDGDGTADPETTAAILSLRDQQRRLTDRLTILSLRHGWAIPSLDAPASAPSQVAESEKQRIFGPAQAAIRARLRVEAITIASRLVLPITPIRIPAE